MHCSKAFNKLLLNVNWGHVAILGHWGCLISDISVCFSSFPRIWFGLVCFLSLTEDKILICLLVRINRLQCATSVSLRTKFPLLKHWSLNLNLLFSRIKLINYCHAEVFIIFLSYHSGHLSKWTQHRNRTRSLPREKGRIQTICVCFVSKWCGPRIVWHVVTYRGNPSKLRNEPCIIFQKCERNILRLCHDIPTFVVFPSEIPTSSRKILVLPGDKQKCILLA